VVRIWLLCEWAGCAGSRSGGCRVQGRVGTVADAPAGGCELAVAVCGDPSVWLRGLWHAVWAVAVGLR
jgi:hypothetical protein